jgi:hypothetical protein
VFDRYPTCDPIDDGLNQCRCLPGARAGEHEQRPAGVVDNGTLGVVENGQVDDSTLGADEAIGRFGHAPISTRAGDSFS